MRHAKRLPTTAGTPLRTTRGRNLLLAWAAACWLALAPVPATAKVDDPFNPAAAAAPEPKEYVVQYFLVVALVGLGLMVVCRPTRRAEKIPEEYIAASASKETVKDV